MYILSTRERKTEKRRIEVDGGLDWAGRDTGRDETANEYKREEEARCEKGQRPGKRERERDTWQGGYAAERDARQSLASKDQQVTLGILRVERGKERESLAFENVCQGRCPHIIAQSIII